MGMSPCVYISASFYAGIKTEEELELLREELDNLGFMVSTGEDNESGIDGNYSEGYITVYTLMTNGWGDSLGIDDLKEEYDIFVNNITEFCVNNDRCKLPRFKIGATYW